jgi:hypothetical protein
MGHGVPELGVVDLADGVGEVVDVGEGDEGLAGHEHLHQLLSQLELILESLLVEKL